MRVSMKEQVPIKGSTNERYRENICKGIGKKLLRDDKEESEGGKILTSRAAPVGAGASLCGNIEYTVKSGENMCEF